MLQEVQRRQLSRRRTTLTLMQALLVGSQNASGRGDEENTPSDALSSSSTVLSRPRPAGIEWTHCRIDIYCIIWSRRLS